MNRIKVNNFNKFEKFYITIIYLTLFVNAYMTNDSMIALINAFCGITYTFFAGKGFPICYLFGAIGSLFYCILALKNSLWGNLLLYGAYYIPMQILGFFQWNKHLKSDKIEIQKTFLTLKNRILLICISILFSSLTIFTIYIFGGKSPIMDGFTTCLSIIGMFLTVQRCIEQWIIWMIVNAISFLMWFNIALQGEKVLSTVFMWGAYFTLAIYFWFMWKKDIKQSR